MRLSLAALILGISAVAVIPAPAEAQAPPLAPQESASLDPVLAPLGDGGDAGRRAAEAASVLGDEYTGAIGDRLAELRKGAPAGIRAAVHAARDARGDLVNALVDLAARRPPDMDARGALVEACLLRSLSHIGTTPAARLVVLAASDAGGELRPELARLVKQLGDRAVPALVEARLSTSSDTRSWAAAMLDGLGKHLPSDSVQTKNDKVLEDVLRAYGAVRDLDALPILLNFANAERAPLRTAARDAVVLYGQDALWKLREQYQAVTGAAAPETMSAADLAKELFDAFDKVRLEEVYARLDEGLAKERLGELAGAVADFDTVLARQPNLERRAEMVPGYLDYARSLEDADRPRAQAYLERALRLSPDAAERARVESEIVFLSGQDLAARGASGADFFRRAVALDPANAKAAAALARIDAQSEERQTLVERCIAAGAVAAVAIVAAILFAGGRRQTKKAGAGRSRDARAPASS